MNKTKAHKIFRVLPFVISFLMVIVFILDFGFGLPESFNNLLNIVYVTAIISFLVLVTLRYIYFTPHKNLTRIWLIDIILAILLILIIADIPYLGFFKNPVFLYFIFFLIFIRELSETVLRVSGAKVNPALLFIFSFLLLIVSGTMLLLLPDAAHHEITFIDALFTSTSAVCVTGLVVVDTGSFFTTVGQVIIIILIQLGGLGIMSFTTFFGYFFKGSTSFGDQLMIRDYFSSEKLSEVYQTLKTIVGVTFIIEIVGAIAIFLSMADYATGKLVDDIFFAIFHSISGFCNAGFSTFAAGLYEVEFQYNYLLQIIIALLFIIGGLGFPIAFNLIKYFHYLIKDKILRHKKYKSAPWIINLNSKLILVSTSILILIGFSLVFVLEYDNVLTDHGLFGKIVTAFFTGVTPRTAGFTSVDMNALTAPTIFLIVLLMWIGASPGSTGGGIKTTTFAISMLNIFENAKGKERNEIFGRQISSHSIRRAFATISLSLIILVVSIFLLMIFEEDKKPGAIIFESFSAIGTVGLSLGITDQLSSPGKIVIIILMFTGRIGMLTILSSVLRKINTYRYKYSEENILIN
ncbi:MAG: TrkH family potassium uptake protein [Cyclobacteriaceae bacterium]